MDIIDEREARRLGKRVRKDGPHDAFLEEHFEDPEHSDILVEKKVKEKKRKT